MQSFIKVGPLVQEEMWSMHTYATMVMFISSFLAGVKE